MKPEQVIGWTVHFVGGHLRSFRQDPQPYRGWTATLLTTSIACFWAFWSGLEGFHEGWCDPRLIVRILGLFVHAAPMLILMALAVVSIWRPKVGAVLMFLFGIAFGVFIYVPGWNRMGIMDILFWIPLTFIPFGVAALTRWGRPRPLKFAYAVAVGAPLLV